METKNQEEDDENEEPLELTYPADALDALDHQEETMPTYECLSLDILDPLKFYDAHKVDPTFSRKWMAQYLDVELQHSDFYHIMLVKAFICPLMTYIWMI